MCHEEVQEGAEAFVSEIHKYKTCESQFARDDVGHSKEKIDIDGDWTDSIVERLSSILFDFS